MSARSALGVSALPGLDYCLNPYVGCSHGCIYCYARSYSLRRGRKEPWGSFVDMKRNLPKVLRKELLRKKRGVVGLSTITDAYQPVEEDARIARECLQTLLDSGFSVSIQTKSALVLRDLDLVTRHQDQVDVGFTITTMDRSISAKIEPGASSPVDRVGALRKLTDNGIATWIFLGPILPAVTDSGLEEVLDAAKSIGAQRVLIDRLNIRPGVWRSVSEFIAQEHPELADLYREIFWRKSSFYGKLKEKLKRSCRRRKLDYSFCF